MDTPTALTHAQNGGLLGHAIMAAAMDVLPDHENEFNAWYSHEHLYERVGLPGFNRGTRWVRTSADTGSSQKYLTIYEADGVDVFASDSYLQALDTPTPWTVDMVRAFVGTSRTVSNVLGSAGPAVGNAISITEFSATSPDVLLTWFWDTLIPRALARPELCGAHICAPDAAATRAKEQTAEAKGFSEPDKITGYTLIVYGLGAPETISATVTEVLKACPDAPFDLGQARLSEYSFLTSLLAQDAHAAAIPSAPPSNFYDVVVAGAGMAGLVAATAALEGGASVLVLEKGTRVGGSMALSHGLIWTIRDIATLRRTEHAGTEFLQELIVNGADEARHWLEKLGVRLGRDLIFNEIGRGQIAEPETLSGVLMARIAELGGTIRTSSPMTGLISEQGVVVGVRMTVDDAEVEVRAGSVVLATGGFQGSPELTARYTSIRSEKVYLRANPWSTGDGLKAAQQVGGALTPSLNTFYGHAMPAPPTRISPQRFLEATQRYGQWAVAVNLEGKRFVDESLGTGEEVLNQAVAQQTDATAAYVFDDEVADRDPGSDLPRARVIVDRALSIGAPVVRADTLEELVAGMAKWGIPQHTLASTFKEYDLAVDSESSEQLTPPRRRFQFGLRRPPFTAVLVRAAITFTGGGLAVDSDMGVVSEFHSASTLRLVSGGSGELSWPVVPGLFAAGCDIGGVSADLYMGGLATALVTGKAAGTAAAQSSGESQRRQLRKEAGSA